MGAGSTAVRSRGCTTPGAEKQLYLAPVDTGRGAYICLTVFDQESSLGLVRMFFADLCRDLAEAAPPAAPVRGPALDVNFEQELHANLTALFAGSGRREAGTRIGVMSIHVLVYVS